MAFGRMVLVAVHALQIDSLAVDEELAVADLDFAEAHVVAGDGDRLAGFVFQGEDEFVEVGRFGGPLGRILDDAGAGVC